MKYDLLCFQISGGLKKFSLIKTITKFQKVSQRKIKDVSDKKTHQNGFLFGS